METTHHQLDEYYARRQIWAKKPQIRLVYQRWVNKIRKFLVDGPLLEVGSGSGLLKDFLPQVILSEVFELPWIDRVIDCMDMPFDENSFTGIICLDLLHHVSQPHTFLNEAARVLRPGGRPCISQFRPGTRRWRNCSFPEARMSTLKTIEVKRRWMLQNSREKRKSPNFSSKMAL